MALMVSLIDDSINALSQRIGDNQQYIVTSGATEQTAQDVTSKLIDQFSDIRPTLYKNHGDIVGVFVNQDIDFSHVYDLRRKR
jgi:type IV secretion system protein VirB10